MTTPQSPKKIDLTKEDLLNIKNKSELLHLLDEKKIDIKEAVANIRYLEDLEKLQIELNKFQRWVVQNKKKIVVVFEGRDASGKGGAIRRILEHISPRSARLVALTKPTEIETQQWYFQRYVLKMPHAGEIVLFDRSWYNRAIVEPVMGFCTKKQYEMHMMQTPEFEFMLHESGIDIIKLWFSITRDEQRKRFSLRSTDPRKQWKLSPVDKAVQHKWKIYGEYKEKTFMKTHTPFCPWHIIKTNNKKIARLECIRHILSLYDYDDKSTDSEFMNPDIDVVMRYNRSLLVKRF